MPTPIFDALVLDARLRQSLVTVRSLGRHGLAVSALTAAASDWLRPRVVGKVTLHEGHTIVRAHAANARVTATGCDAAARRVARSIACRVAAARGEPGERVQTSGAGRIAAVAGDTRG